MATTKQEALARGVGARFVVALDNIDPRRTVYLAAHPQWDAAWYGPPSAARRYKTRGGAERAIAARGAAWLTFNPRVAVV